MIAGEGLVLMMLAVPMQTMVGTIDAIASPEEAVASAKATATMASREAKEEMVLADEGPGRGPSRLPSKASSRTTRMVVMETSQVTQVVVTTEGR